MSCYDAPWVLIHLSFSTIKLHTDKIECIQKRWFVRRMFDNAQDAASVVNSFRDIVTLMNGFQVSGCGDCVKR